MGGGGAVTKDHFHSNFFQFLSQNFVKINNRIWPERSEGENFEKFFEKKGILAQK